MFIYCDRADGLYGIYDTDDKTTEYVTLDDIRHFISVGVQIKGVEPDCMLVQTKYSMMLERMERGTPLEYFISDIVGYKTCVYGGRSGKMLMLVDENGVFGVSYDYLHMHRDREMIRVGNVDPVKVASILQKVHMH